ncbi:MAG: folate family ECF transporter S component [Bacillota bacterium]|nr:folate family ECF transporter S component [Bacillota bacterium]
MSCSPFCREYWKSAAKELKKPGSIVFAALMVSLSVAVGSFFIPVGINLRIYFTFIASAAGAAVYGPVVALIYGVAADLVGFLIHPTGAFFPGYTLSTMLSAFIFALFFYKSRITVIKVFFAKLTVNLLINVGLGALWSSILFGKGYYYFLAKSIVKNVLMLPFEVVILMLILNYILPTVQNRGKFQ